MENKKLEIGIGIFEKYVSSYIKKAIVTVLTVWTTFLLFAWTVGLSDIRDTTIRAIERASSSEQFQNALVNYIMPDSEKREELADKIRQVEQNIILIEKAQKHNTENIKNNTHRIHILEKQNTK